MSRAPTLSYMMDRLAQRQAPAQQGRMPNTGQISSLPRENRRDAVSIAKWFTEEKERAMACRRRHAIEWTKVLSILSGIHYYKITSGGAWTPLQKKDPRDIRCKLPLMTPLVFWEHARLSSNQIGYTVTPATGRGPNAYWQAKMAQDTLNHWVEEAEVEWSEDEANMHLVIYGGFAYHVERQPFRKQANLVPMPFCDLLPFPHDARTWKEMNGVGRITIVSDSWLEQQDELYERQFGKPPARPMSKAVRSVSTDLGGNYPGFSTGFGYRTPSSGAVAMWVWMKPTELNPYGEHLFFLDDELHGYVSGVGQDGRPIALVNGELPLYPVYYRKHSHDWWPEGFAESQVSMQHEGNRQMNNLLRSANVNRGFLGYNSELVSASAIQDNVDGLIPFKNPGPEDRTPPLMRIEPATATRETGMVLSLVQQFSKQAAGYMSDVIFGGQEGRTEGGPATQLLDQRSQTALEVIIRRKWRALKRVGYDALEAIRDVWPEQKVINVVGPQNLAQERAWFKQDMPDPRTLRISPMPLIPNGRMGMFQMLMQLRGTADDSQKPLITAMEMRRSLAILGLVPPGIDIFDKVEQRIVYRLGQLINDGVTPAIPPAGSGQDMQEMEDHQKAVQIIKEAMLDPMFAMYSPQVKKAVSQEIGFHSQMLDGISRSVDNFDDAIERFDATQMEDSLEAMENDPMSSAGLFAPHGVLVGAA